MDTLKRFSQCSHWGAYTVVVDGKQIVDIEPFSGDPSPSPLIQSVKNWMDPARRIATPMIREGWLKSREGSDRSGRGREKFIPVSWDEAFELASGEIKRVSNDFGNASIFAGSYGWTSCGRFHHASSLLKRTLNLVGGYTGHVDTYSIAAGPAILRHTLGNAAACSGQANTLDSIAAHTETLVIFGALSPRTAQLEAGGRAQHNLETHLREMVKRKIKVILISPFRDDLPDWVDAEWWPIRPNTDTALALALAGEIVKAGDHDVDFLNRCCSGADEFLAYLTGASDGIEKNATWAASITDISPTDISALAKRLASTRSMITMSWSLQRAHHGEHAFWSAIALAAVAGQIGLPGGGVGFGYGSLGGVGEPFRTSMSPMISQLKRPNSDFIPVARITDLLTQPGASFDYEGQTYTYPDTRLVYWAGGNPFHHHQDLNRFETAWHRPETIIVQDPMWTATALRADIVLPASTSLERNDIAGNRRSDHIVAMHKAVEPLGQARSDYEIFRGLSERLGVEAAFSEGRDEMDWLRHIYDGCKKDAEDAHGFIMPDFDNFWQDGFAIAPTHKDHTYLDVYRTDPEAHALATESGRIVLTSDLLADRDYSDCPKHPAWIAPQEWLGGPETDDDQLHLISHQPAGRLHSQLETAPTSMAMKHQGREQVRISETDAKRFGVSQGQTVRLWNQRGQCLASALVCNDVRQGVAILPTGGWLTRDGDSDLELSGNPNVLTADIPTSQFGQGCSAHTCMIRIEPYRGKISDATEQYQEMIDART